jgi:hypothetical protein
MRGAQGFAEYSEAGVPNYDTGLFGQALPKKSVGAVFDRDNGWRIGHSLKLNELGVGDASHGFFAKPSVVLAVSEIAAGLIPRGGLSGSVLCLALHGFRLLMLGGGFASQFEFGARRVVLHVVGQIPRARQRLTGDLNLAACEHRRGWQHQHQCKFPSGRTL